MSVLSISEFAAACGLSVPALRRYDEAGVLEPAYVDERTGYRWYEPDQIGTGTLVRTLRQLDVPLPAVAAILALPDPAARLARLEQHWAQVERALQQGRGIRDHLARLLGGWQDLIAEHEVRSRPVGELPVLLRRRRIDMQHFLDEVERGVAVLRERAAREGLSVVGCPVSLYPCLPDEVVDEADRVLEVCLPVAGDGVDGVADAVLPGGHLLHTDAEGARARYPGVLAAYGAVSQWTHEHGLRLAEPPLMVHRDRDRVQAGWRLPDAPGPGAGATR